MNKKALKTKAKEENEKEFEDADPNNWKLSTLKFGGSYEADSFGKEKQVTGKSIKKGIEKFKADPIKYYAMSYQTDMISWPTNEQKYTLLHRAGTKCLKPTEVSETGWMSLLLYDYQSLPGLPNNVLPKEHRDKYTDNMVHNGKKLHSDTNIPLMPGRGMGIVDTPNIKLIGDVDPEDIKQGEVGDCWLLSAIAALAEFDGAVKKLFRKTPDVDNRPLKEPNMYTVTLWDLETWTEVDIKIDERLAVRHDGRLLASRPSEDGELWVPYLEKAIACHCGGWDTLVGGQCTHAWAMMTGCKHQYVIRRDKEDDWGAFAKFNPKTRDWSPHKNAHREAPQTMWRASWPKVGGGGGKKGLDDEELFQKMCAWDQENYIMSAGVRTKAGKDGGLVDDHAYSVIECINDVAGTDIDLIKVRNPWGKGEIEDGQFDDDGPGWDEYPQVKKALNPEVKDDGIFWVTKDEFFDFFETFFLSASNMTEFLED